MAEVIKVRNVPAQNIGVVNSAPCPEMNIVAKEITENGRYEAHTEGVTGFDPVIVNVPSREEIGYENGYAAGYDEGYDKGYEVAGEYSVTEEDLTFSGDIENLFYNGQWTKLIDRFGSLMKFNNITNADSCFYECLTVADLSKLRMKFDGAEANYIFYWCRVLEKLPNATGSISACFSNAFFGGYMITSDEINKFFSGLTYKESRSDPSGISGVFVSCCSVRNLEPFLNWLDNHLKNYTGTQTTIINYHTAFNNCASLDEITNLPVIRPDLTKTSNAFSGTFTSCYRLKNLIFKTDNGTPYKANWKSQAINLTSGVGYTSSVFAYDITNYNSGITSKKEVNNYSSYQRLKDDPDWYSTSYAYSRYNHDSAVNTINSLPDTSEYLASAGGTNTIMFRARSGYNTDGGAINTLTAEEIAVATAKGWTVTFA